MPPNESQPDARNIFAKGTANQPVVPGRSCGACTACCTQLAFPMDGTDKLVGETCRHCTGQGCGIYTERPQFCRGYECVWKVMPALDESWRPDLSGVFIIWSDVPEGTRAAFAVDINVIGPTELMTSDRFVGLVCGFVAKGVATFLTLPRGIGYYSTTARLDTLLGEITRRRDREGARELLEQIRTGMLERPARPYVKPQQ